jgi:hypothetical protein
MRTRRSTLFRALLSLIGSGLAVLLPAGFSQAQSLWNLEGLGAWQEGYDLAARGAGSTAIGVPDPFGMSPVNPAQTAWATLPGADFAVVTQNRWISRKGVNGAHRAGDTRLPGARAVIPGPRFLRWALGYRDLTNGACLIELTQNRGREDEFKRTLTGRGGLGELSADLAAPLLDGRAALGLQLGLAQGTLRDVIEDRYVSSAFLGTSQTIRTRMENLRTWSLGLQAKPIAPLTMGAVYHGGSHIDLKSMWTPSTGVGFISRATMQYPSGFGLGGAYVVRHRTRVTLDWSRWEWSGADFRVDGSSAAGSSGSDSVPPSSAGGGFLNLRDADRVGLGITRLPGETNPKDPLLKRSLYRIGFTWGRQPVRQWDPITRRPGASVSEWAVTGGVGLPVQVDRGFVNGLVEVGQTGNLGEVGLRETFVRLGLGVTFGKFPNRF